MKYIITGAAGHISGPLTEKLLEANHEVTLIGRDAGKLEKYRENGAKIAAGSVDDAAFLEGVFRGADAAYLMIPQNPETDDFRGFQQRVAENYVQALKTNGIKKVVVLSSIGAHMGKGAGPVDGVAYLEQIITRELPSVDVVFLRPSYFFYNLFQQAGLIKNMNIMGGNFNFTDEKMVLTHTSDIVVVAFEQLNNLDFTGKTVKYIASDERSTEEIREELAKASGKPETPWIQFSDEQAYGGMLQAGVKPSLAKDYTDMGRALREGKMQEEYWKNRPSSLGRIKLKEFAQEFAAVYANI